METYIYKTILYVYITLYISDKILKGWVQYIHYILRCHINFKIYGFEFQNFGVRNKRPFERRCCFILIFKKKKPLRDRHFGTQNALHPPYMLFFFREFARFRATQSALKLEKLCNK